MGKGQPFILEDAEILYLQAKPSKRLSALEGARSEIKKAASQGLESVRLIDGEFGPSGLEFLHFVEDQLRRDGFETSIGQTKFGGSPPQLRYTLTVSGWACEE